MNAQLNCQELEHQPSPPPATCCTCPYYELNLCAAVRRNPEPEADRRLGPSAVWSSAHTIPARRTICHPNEWSEFVPVICRGWAASSLALPDGRRQILSFLLPGDIVFSAGLLEPMSGRLVEAVTEVTYRNIKRNEIKALLFERRDVFEKFTKTWIEERKQTDQLAVDLGRRTADEGLPG